MKSKNKKYFLTMNGVNLTDKELQEKFYNLRDLILSCYVRDLEHGHIHVLLIFEEEKTFKYIYQNFKGFIVRSCSLPIDKAKEYFFKHHEHEYSGFISVTEKKDEKMVGSSFC